MQILLLFVLVLVGSFAAVLFLTKPKESERRVQERLSGISGAVPTLGDEPIDIIKRIKYSDIPWLDNLFRQYAVFRNLKSTLDQADSSWTVGRIFSATILIFVLVAWLGGFWFPNLPLRLVLAAVFAVLPYFTVRFQRQRRFRQFENVLSEGIDLMSRALRAGHSVSSAIEMVGQEVGPPVGLEFRKTFEQQNFGLPFREALEDLARRTPISDLQFLVTAILVQKESGGNLAEVLDKAALVIRERHRLKGELRIYTVQGRLTGWILGLLPFIMFILLGLINSAYVRVLIEDPLGQKLVMLGLGLMALGFYVIRRIVDIKV